MRTIYLGLFALLLVLTGCDKNGPSTDAEEERNPLITSAQKHMEDGKYEEAIKVFKQAIDSNPMMARPHLDLAIIYQQYVINYIHAIYHYDRYLELRPADEKVEFINEQKMKVAKALANTLINNSKEVKQVIRERNEFIKQNKELRRQLSANPSQSATKTIPKTAKSSPKKSMAPQTVAKKTPAQTQPTSSAKHQIYHVVGGDTLTKIATKFYNDPGKWDVIFNANNDSMRSAGDLRIGQTLVIPAIGN